MVALSPEPGADLVGDPLTGWLDDVLAGLADGVAECEGLRDAGRSAGCGAH